ncbi:MAG: CbtA family protein [SAR202 cluster bacterium]|nr:CbtA family protein [SAR202 cluster bacterium]
MPRILIVGLLVGLLAGLLVGGFHNLFTVPVIERAIDIEEARSALENPNAPEEDPLVSLRTQRWGMALGTGIYGAILGIVFAAGYSALRRVAPDWKPLALAITAATLGFWALSLFPFIRYPLVPPGVGEPDTLTYRQGLQITFMILSVVGVGVLLYGLREINQRFQETRIRLKMYSGAALAYVVFAVIMFFAYPPNPDPVPVPIDLLELFRTLSMIGQFLIWALMAAGAVAGIQWYERRDAKTGNHFDSVTGARVN